MDMDADKRYLGSKAFEWLVKKCQKLTTISVQARGGLFFVSIIDPDPYFAQKYINTLVNIYVEENLHDKREESYDANRFLTEQVTFYKQKLDEIDNKIIVFRKETGIYSAANEPSIMAQIAEDEDSLREIKSQKTENYATIKTIKQQLDMLRETTALGYRAPFDGSGAGNSVNQRIGALQAEIDELLLIYNHQYPTVVKLKAQLKELQQRQQGKPPSLPVAIEQSSYNPVEDPIYVDLKMRINTAQSVLNALTAAEKELMAEVQANQDLLRNFPQDNKKLNDLEREKNIQEDIYEQLLQRVGISEVSKQMEVSDKASTFRIVDPAILANNPVGTKRILYMLMGILGGLGAGLGAVYLAEHVNNSIKGSQQLQSLGATVLAEIPFIWSDVEIRLIKKKDRAALAFATVCGLMIGVMLMHDLLGMSFIDRVIADLKIGKL
jgi:polysaccharide chain length determinant protein (PEP-CTERM system associated)